MNHKKVYDDLISAVMPLKASRKKNKRGTSYYYEYHHVIPRAIDMSLDKVEDNRVILTAREHYIAHRLLPFIYGEVMTHAWRRRFQPYRTSRKYELVRRHIAAEQRVARRGKSNPMYGQDYNDYMTPEASRARAERSAALLRGRPRPQSVKDAVSIAQKARAERVGPWGINSSVGSKSSQYIWRCAGLIYKYLQSGKTLQQIQHKLGIAKSPIRSTLYGVQRYIKEHGNPIHDARWKRHFNIG